MDVKNYPIFEIGKWNGMEFGHEDLSEIAKNFAELGDVQHVPLKLGHNDDQHVTDGQPALGWVRGLRKVGSQLVADFADMPAVIAEAIKKKLYRTVSIELVKGAQIKDKTLGWVLDAVAILGADKPAVNTLPDLSRYLASRADFIGGRRVVFEALAGKRKVIKTGDTDMDEDEVKRLIATSVQAAIDPLKKENDELRKNFTAERDKNLELDGKVKKQEIVERERVEVAKKEATTFARKAATEVIEQAVKAKKITPAQRDQTIKLFGVDDDERVVKLDLDTVKAYFGAQKLAGMSERDTTRSGGEGGDERVEPNVFDEVDRRARVEVAKDPTGKRSYQQALRVVFSADPKLHREYLDTTPPELMRKAGGAQ